MKDLKSIFNHPPKSNPENDPHLYDWKRPFYGKNDATYLNKLLKAKRRKSSPERFSSGKVRSNGSVNSRKQRVLLKLSYGESSAKHLKYIRLYMPQINKEGVEEKKEIFGSPIEDYMDKVSETVGRKYVPA